MATSEITPDALFFRKPNMTINNQPKVVKWHFNECHMACENAEMLEKDSFISRVCDATCLNNNSWMSFRFNGHNCGAGDSSKYGKSCRLCFTDQQAALDADHVFTSSNGNLSTSHDHVIMCDTKRPPEAIDCSTVCKNNRNTVWTFGNHPKYHVDRKKPDAESHKQTFSNA